MNEQEAKAWAEHWWRDPRSQAAEDEGWNIFDCEGNDYGRWQIQASYAAGVLDCDNAAWRIVFQGKQRHHIDARNFIRQANPEEWLDWCRRAHRLELDVTQLNEALLAEIAVARLTA